MKLKYSFAKFVNYFIVVLFFLIALTGVFSLDGLSFLPVTYIFEAMLFSSLLITGFNLKKDIFAISSLTAIYVIYFMLKASFQGEANMYDALLALKAFIYLFVLGVSVNGNWLNEKTIIRIFDFLKIMFAVKYGYSRFFDFSHRPGLFAENNYELLMLFLLAAGVWHFRGIVSMSDVVLLIFVSVLSGSRSAMVELIFLLLIFIKYIVRSKMGAVLLVCICIFAYFVISERSDGGIEAIDRFVFFQLFLQEVKYWGIWDWIAGANPITPLGGETCTALQFYDALFSFSGNGACYSVILHSMLMRSIFDHGFLGLIWMLTSIYYFFIISGYGIKFSFLVLGLLLINATSVSAFNSIFAVLPMLMLLLVRQNSIILSRMQI